MKFSDIKPTDHEERALITVAGRDTIGVVYQISRVLAEAQINILNITQELMEGYFTMMVLVDLKDCNTIFAELNSRLKSVGESLGMTVHIQDTQLYNAMYRV